VPWLIDAEAYAIARSRVAEEVRTGMSPAATVAMSR
jgi:hypothetical protein